MITLWKDSHKTAKGKLAFGLVLDHCSLKSLILTFGSTLWLSFVLWGVVIISIILNDVFAAITWALGVGGGSVKEQSTQSLHYNLWRWPCFTWQGIGRFIP